MSTQEPCPRIEALSALADDELRGEERVAQEAHAAGCAICAPVLAEMRHLRTRFAALPEVSPGFDVAAEVGRRIAAATAGAQRGAPRSRRPRWWQVALLAPGGAIAVAAGMWLGAAAMPMALSSTGASSAQMAAFSTLPPGAVCPASGACGRRFP